MIKVKISVDIWLKFCKVEDNGSLFSVYPRFRIFIQGIDNSKQNPFPKIRPSWVVNSNLLRNDPLWIINWDWARCFKKCRRQEFIFASNEEEQLLCESITDINRSRLAQVCLACNNVTYTRNDTVNSGLPLVSNYTWPMDTEPILCSIDSTVFICHAFESLLRIYIRLEIILIIEESLLNPAKRIISYHNCSKLWISCPNFALMKQ